MAKSRRAQGSDQWKQTEAETQAANVKALLQDQLRREKPLAEAEHRCLVP